VDKIEFLKFEISKIIVSLSGLLACWDGSLANCDCPSRLYCLIITECERWLLSSIGLSNETETVNLINLN
jgi:hypothetical protein